MMQAKCAVCGKPLTRCYGRNRKVYCHEHKKSKKAHFQNWHQTAWGIMTLQQIEELGLP